MIQALNVSTIAKFSWIGRRHKCLADGKLSCLSSEFNDCSYLKSVSYVEMFEPVGPLMDKQLT